MLIQNSLNWWRQLTFSSKYRSKVVTAFRNLVVYFWHNIIMFLAHSECTRFSYIQVSVHYQTRGPILQKLSAGSIQLRVKKKRNLYLSFTVVVRELWLLYIYMHFGCLRVWGKTLLLTGIMNLIIKVNAAKIYFNENMSAFGVFWRIIPISGENLVQILTQLADQTVFKRPGTHSYLECTQPRPLLLDPPHLSVQEPPPSPARELYNILEYYIISSASADI